MKDPQRSGLSLNGGFLREELALISKDLVFEYSVWGHATCVWSVGFFLTECPHQVEAIQCPPVPAELIVVSWISPKEGSDSCKNHG